MPTASINGIDLYYTTAGEGLPCLVMHGGLGLDHTYLHPNLDPLGEMMQLVYYDHRGNGQSGRPAKETMTHEQFAADAKALAEHLGFKKVAVIGHSYGGFIALEFALRYPHLLSHLILFDTAPASNYIQEVMDNAVRMGATEEMLKSLQADVNSNEEMHQQLLTITPLYFKNYVPEIANRLLKNVIVNVSGHAAEGELENYNVIPRLSEIQIPTLILVGRYDFVCPPSQAQILHEGIPNSELVVFEDSGHFAFVEEPDNFFKSIREWIQRTV